ncbi:MAG: universal stress protein [Deltaproteobacteria bacterium]|nr:universal stress protein [Deltaproteobacteria bacterium]
MSIFKNILVAFDYSDSAIQALKTAFDLAKRNQGKVNVVHVLSEDVANAFVIPITKEYIEDIQKSLNDAVNKHLLPDYKDGLGSISVLHGAPGLAIAEAAEKQNCDLIVMGSHSRNAIEEAFLGSVAKQSIRHATTPVWVVKQEARRQFKKILVPIDESPESEQIIPLALKLSGQLNAVVQLVNVVDVTDFSYYIEFNQILDKAKQKTQKRLQELKEKHGIPTEPLILDGKASDAIIHVIQKDKDIGLVAMTTHGRSGLKRFFMGSVTESVAQHVPCSILTTHLEEHKAAVKEAVQKDIKEFKDQLASVKM